MLFFCINPLMTCHWSQKKVPTTMALKVLHGWHIPPVSTSFHLPSRSLYLLTFISCLSLGDIKDFTVLQCLNLFLLSGESTSKFFIWPTNSNFWDLTQRPSHLKWHFRVIISHYSMFSFNDGYQYLKINFKLDLLTFGNFLFPKELKV